MTLQEERAALQKRMDEIDAEIAGFVPGWYACWNRAGYGAYIVKKDTLADLRTSRDGWDHVEPFHTVAHKFLPEGWEVVGPESKTLYDWSKAPEWANWAAMDGDGEACWYKEKPETDEEYDIWGTAKQYENADETITIYRSVPWDQSLEQRPGITQ